MKTTLLAIVCGLAWTEAVHAQDTFDKVLDAMLPTFTKLGDTLATIKDKDSADKAKPTIQEVVKEMTKLKERGEKLGEPMGKQKEELEKKYKSKLEDAARKLSIELVRIKSDVSGGDEIVKEVSELLGGLAKKKK